MRQVSITENFSSLPCQYRYTQLKTESLVPQTYHRTAGSSDVPPIHYAQEWGYRTQASAQNWKLSWRWHAASSKGVSFVYCWWSSSCETWIYAERTLNIFLNWELRISSTLLPVFWITSGSLFCLSVCLLDPCRPSAGARCTKTVGIKLFWVLRLPYLILDFWLRALRAQWDCPDVILLPLPSGVWEEARKILRCFIFPVGQPCPKIQ